MMSAIAELFHGFRNEFEEQNPFTTEDTEDTEERRGQSKCSNKLVWMVEEASKQESPARVREQSLG